MRRAPHATIATTSAAATPITARADPGVRPRDRRERDRDRQGRRDGDRRARCAGESSAYFGLLSMTMPSFSMRR
jgi:hypothetical protein